jgi:hypothetical protein
MLGHSSGKEQLARVQLWTHKEALCKGAWTCGFGSLLNVEELLSEALLAFQEKYNGRWLVERSGYRSRR